MAIRVSKDRINMDDKLLEQPVLKDYGETVVTANSGTSYTIDLTGGNVFNITLTGNCEFTFANPPASGTAGSFTLILTQDATGGRTATWPVATQWLGGVTPSLESVAESVNIFTFLTITAGTTWIGADAGSIAVPPPPFSGYLDYGWFGGGGGATTSIVDRIEYANDTATASLRGPLTLARFNFAATGNSSYGWFGGGWVFSPSVVNYSTVDRVDYANDTTTASLRGPLSIARRYLAAAGNSSYGWFGGGYGGGTRSTIDRIDYANDTPTATARGPLTATVYGPSANGNSSYGWFSASSDSRIDRIDYANDTATASTRGPLSLGRSGVGAVGTTSYGWFAGGYSGGAQTTVDRIDYATDTNTASVRGSLSAARYVQGAAGNGSYGWLGAGSGSVTTVDRIDYANDTNTATTRGPLAVGRNALAATQSGPLA